MIFEVVSLPLALSLAARGAHHIETMAVREMSRAVRAHTRSVSGEFDVAIVGAGIHGTGIAQAAAAAGHSVLLLEQTAVAHGSSSRSSKLIHGGLRYLESGQFSLVRESLRERALMLRLAPELVQVQRFYIPVYAHTRRRPWQLRWGLALYALLSGLRPESRFGTVPRREWDRLDGLETAASAGGVLVPGRADRRSRADARRAAFGRVTRRAVALPGARSMRRVLIEDGVELRYTHRRRRHRLPRTRAGQCRGTVGRGGCALRSRRRSRSRRSSACRARTWCSRAGSSAASTISRVRTMVAPCS